MNKILPDTNIILDIALERREFFEKSKELMLTINKLSIPTIIITRNIADFKKSKLEIFTPSEFISQLS
jgi:rRNA-processing protein FCF1